VVDGLTGLQSDQQSAGWHACCADFTAPGLGTWWLVEVPEGRYCVAGWWQYTCCTAWRTYMHVHAMVCT
jgi:hypothetical protein